MGADAKGKQVMKRRIRREVLAYFADLPRCVVGIEACGGAHYWAREINRLGHEARLINPKFVKALSSWREERLQRCGGVVQAVVSPWRCVSKTPEERGTAGSAGTAPAARRVDRQRTVWINRARGLLAERGIVLESRYGSFSSKVCHGYLKRWAMGSR